MSIRGTAPPDPVDLPFDIVAAPTQEIVTTLSREQVTVSTEWAVSGHVRLRRHVVTETQMLPITVRREELIIEVVTAVYTAEGHLVGTDQTGPTSSEPADVKDQAVLVLHREVPEVTLRVEPYERATVDIATITDTFELDNDVRHEQLAVEQIDLTAAPESPTNRPF